MPNLDPHLVLVSLQSDRAARADAAPEPPPDAPVPPAAAAPGPPSPAGEGGLTPTVLREVHGELAAGRKIGAIKIVREATGWGLKDSKEYVDGVESRGS